MKLRESTTDKVTYDVMYRITIDTAFQKDLTFDDIKSDISLGSLNDTLDSQAKDLVIYYTGSVIGITSVLPAEYKLVGNYLYLDITIKSDHELTSNEKNDLGLFLATQLVNGWGSRVTMDPVGDSTEYTINFDVSKSQWILSDKENLSDNDDEQSRETNNNDDSDTNNESEEDN